jgi:RNA polymerase sigma factor (sigma-70 family)
VGDGTIFLPRYASAVSWRELAPVKAFDQEFEAFFVRHFEQIVNSLTVITGDRDRATDATQEAFIKAYARWTKIRTYDVPAAWVRRIAINASRDTRRSERRRARREKTHLAAPHVFPSNDVVGLDFAQRILAELPRRQREVATLFYLDDLSVNEIAKTLDVSAGTVKSHLAEARERLRAFVDVDEEAS